MNHADPSLLSIMAFGLFESGVPLTVAQHSQVSNFKGWRQNSFGDLRTEVLQREDYWWETGLVWFIPLADERGVCR